MPRETTPKKITLSIKRLCKKIAPQNNLLKVPVIIEPYAQLNECFPNVKIVVEKNGGSMISGWAIWQWANIMIEAEAHAVWKKATGDLVDIIPHDDGEKEIL